jgi:thymidine phosphorylase
MAIMIKVMGVEMPIVSYVVKLVKKGKTVKARRSIAEIYSVGYNRADEAVKEIQRKLKIQDKVFEKFIDDIT